MRASYAPIGTLGLLLLATGCSKAAQSPPSPPRPAPEAPGLGQIGPPSCYAPEEIEALIDGLAISEEPASDRPVYTPSVDTPRSDPRVRGYEAAAKLKEYGWAAFPLLLAHLEDDRQAICFKRALPCDVGLACFSIIEDQIFSLPSDYPGSFYRMGADGLQHERPLYLRPVLFGRPNVQSWLECRSRQSMEKLQLEAIKWLIAEERKIGFLDEESKNRYLYPLERQRDQIKARIQAEMGVGDSSRNG